MKGEEKEHERVWMDRRWAQNVMWFWTDAVSCCSWRRSWWTCRRRWSRRRMNWTNSLRVWKMRRRNWNCLRRKLLMWVTGHRHIWKGGGGGCQPSFTSLEQKCEMKLPVICAHALMLLSLITCFLHVTMTLLKTSTNKDPLIHSWTISRPEPAVVWLWSNVNGLQRLLHSCAATPERWV